MGRHFIIRTDQRSLKFLLEQREVGTEYQRWLCKIMSFDFEIQYKPGVSNKVADALSRKFELDTETECNLLTSSYGISLEPLKKEIENDHFLQRILIQLQQNQPPMVGFTMEGGRLLYKGRLVIPKNSSLIPSLLKEYHDSTIGGHAGEMRTYQRIAAEWFWAGMRKDVIKHVQECSVCQQQKAMTTHPAGLLQPLALPNLVWEEITMDFVEDLPLSSGVDTVLVFVDRLSKYAHFLGLKHPFTAPKVAALFVKEIVRLHGFPQSIVTDRDRIFMSQFWRELFRLQGTVLKRSTAYHPQSDGQSEVVNKTLELCLRCFVQGKNKKWAQWLPWAEFWYNTSYQMSAKYTPFKLLYGRDPPRLIRQPYGPITVGSVEEVLQEREAVLDELKFNLLWPSKR